MAEHRGTLVTGVIGADIHNIGLTILASALDAAGFKVVTLGILVSQDKFVKAAVEVAADAILVSSLYGHGELDCPGLRDRCVEAGLNVEHYLPISTMVPHALSMACAILDSLIAAAQGVRDITLGFGQQCHLAQDAAALHLYPGLCGEYLARLGLPDVRLSTVMSQWMGGFPPDEGQAFAVICLASVAAYLGHATDMITKSPHEAAGIPTPEANASGLRASRMVLRMLADQKLAPIPEIATEAQLMEAEARAILDRALELGAGDAALAAVRAVEAGVIDVPFSPYRGNANRALPARDWRGAVRLMKAGDLPLPPEIQERHRAEIARRLGTLGARLPWEILLEDVNAISRGSLLAEE